ncbi:MAG: sulfite exporter TauE/SafE family protein [Xanthobacteraceae bacterium]
MNTASEFREVGVHAACAGTTTGVLFHHSLFAIRRSRDAAISFSYLEIAYCAVVIVASYALRGSTGFGGAVAMPLLALVVPLKILVPVWTLLGIASSVTIVARDYRSIAVYELLRTLPAGLIGIAVGLYVFTALDAGTLARGLGLLVIAYGFYALWTTRPAAGPRPAAGSQPSSRLLAPVAGILGGAVGTTFGTMASIFYAIYFDAIRLAKHHFRATMSAMILSLSLVRGLGYFAVGEFGLEALKTFALFFPMMLIGVFVGDHFYGGISERVFRRLVAAVLILSGVALLVK